MIEAMHSFHPILVHFTIALLVTSAFLLLVGKIFINKPWAEKCRTAGGWNLVIGAITSVPTVAAGFYAFATVAHDTPSHLAMIEHRNMALATTLLWCALAIWRVRVLSQHRRSGWPFFTSVLVAFALLIFTGYKGGGLVFHHGLGVASLPESSGEGHDHEHSAGHGHGDESNQAVEATTADSHDKTKLTGSSEGRAHDNSDGHHDAAASEVLIDQALPAEIIGQQKHDDGHEHAHEAEVEQAVEPVSEAAHGHDDTDGHAHDTVAMAKPESEADHEHDSNSETHSH